MRMCAKFRASVQDQKRHIGYVHGHAALNSLTYQLEINHELSKIISFIPTAMIKLTRKFKFEQLMTNVNRQLSSVRKTSTFYFAAGFQTAKIIVSAVNSSFKICTRWDLMLGLIDTGATVIMLHAKISPY